MEKHKEALVWKGAASGNKVGGSSIIVPSKALAEGSLKDFGVEAYKSGEAKTQGEKSFHNWVYWGNGFGVNLVLSAMITYFFHDTTRGKTLYEGLLKGYEKMGIKDENARVSMAKALTLLTGGHFTAIAIKKAEDNKLDIVRWFDERNYGKDAENIPEIRAAHARVAEESAPTWLNIALTRLVCALTIQTVANRIGNEEGNALMRYGQEKNIPALKKFSIEGPSRIVGEQIVKYTPKPIENGFNWIFSPVATNGGHDIYQKFMTYTAIDTLYTLLTAKMLKPVSAALENLPGMRHYPNAGAVIMPPEPAPLIIPRSPELQLAAAPDPIAQTQVKPSPERASQSQIQVNVASEAKPKAENKPKPHGEAKQPISAATEQTTSKPKPSVIEASSRGVVKPQAEISHAHA